MHLLHFSLRNSQETRTQCIKDSLFKIFYLIKIWVLVSIYSLFSDVSLEYKNSNCKDIDNWGETSEN